VKRREFLSALGGAAWPLAVRAQQPAKPVVGVLMHSKPDVLKDSEDAIRKGLSEAGFVDGRNVTFEFRWSNEQSDLVRELAAELVRRKVDVIIAAGLTATVAAKGATTTIPIVFNIGVDPVERGFVASLNRPGGNLTGFTNLNVALEPKRLELLREVVPAASVFGLLVNPNNPLAASITKGVEAAARTLGVTLLVLPVSSEHEIDAAFATMIQRRARGIVIGNDALFINRPAEIGALSLRHAMPTIFEFREFAAAGGLMSYGGSRSDPYRLVGIYAGRVLKGEKPADLPVQQSTKVELIINLKTARALGLTVPLPLLGRADEVIE
jgi:putative tryptophan/tyrosine transport system substrate-binding protein